MKILKLNNLKILKERRKRLRNSATPAEAALWTIIKGKQLSGFKFRRQHSIGIYVVDFYCPQRKLAIELDGNDHFAEEQIVKDKKRTEYLNKLGVRVIRIENENVFKNSDIVLSFILDGLNLPLLKEISAK